MLVASSRGSNSRIWIKKAVDKTNELRAHGDPQTFLSSACCDSCIAVGCTEACTFGARPRVSQPRQCLVWTCEGGWLQSSGDGAVGLCEKPLVRVGAARSALVGAAAS